MRFKPRNLLHLPDEPAGVATQSVSCAQRSKLKLTVLIGTANLNMMYESLAEIRRQMLCLACIWACLLSVAAADDLPQTAAAPRAQPVATDVLDYGRHIRPILSNNCFKCHGPDEKGRKAGLRLDLRDAGRMPTESGAVAIVPGKPAESELIARITATGADEVMPPPGSNKKLTPQEIELLREWIRQGAGQKLHWSYVKPLRPELPDVRDQNWVRTGIDRFILHRLERAGMKPAPEADRATLIRRLTLDLTGLPPTPTEVDDFIGDSRPEAYEKVVERLLDSPHFGERMAQDWLDYSRYGDTNGYEHDSERSIWKYRDWVIEAFNANMPFDRFTIEQIAGDLLPDATPWQRTATGFHRNVTYNQEGGSDPEEFRIRYAVDRTSTTATVFLGMTMACAECHDHKYDPVSQRDFYSVLAFFNNVEGEKGAKAAGAQGKDELLPPLLTFPTPEQARALQEVRGQLADVTQRIMRELATVKLEDPAAGAADVKPAEPREYAWLDDALPTGAVAQGSDAEASWKWVERSASNDNRLVFSGKFSHTQTATGLSQHYFTGVSAGLRIGDGDTLFAYVLIDPQNPPKTLMLQFNDGSWEHRAYWGADLVPWGVAGTPSRLPAGPLPTFDGWVRLEVSAQAVGLAAGCVVNGMAFTQVDGKVHWDKAGIVTRTQQPPLPEDSLAAWERIELGAPNSPMKLPKPISDLLSIPVEKRTEAQKTELRNYFVRFVYRNVRETFDPLNKQFDELKAAQDQLEKAIPSTMVMAEMANPRPAFVLIRGNFETRGEQVAPNAPSVLPPLAAGQPANRLGLARWLVDKENPLTARVTVNRYWKQFFGTGLVKTVEDFGLQGEFPSHPELLDWLAVEFMEPSESRPLRMGGEAGWNVKAFLKLLVMSATYRQSSKPQSHRGESDPSNRLLSHAARFRMSAEAVRDNALAISGLLCRDIGGKSVFPPQPSDFYGDKGGWKWEPSTGKDRYRRGMYTFWRRTVYYPALQAFDAPSREICAVDRARTNTPLQALVTLNDPVFVEAARVLGQHVMQEGGPSLAGKLIFAFRLCVARRPSDQELAVLGRLFAAHLAKYQADRVAALTLVSNDAAPRPEGLDVAELAAWTALGNGLLNLDETITRE